MSYKGWLIAVILSIILIYGGIFLIRSMPPNFAEPPVYDIEKYGIPMFVDDDFIELDKIEYIKRYRSGLGIDTSDRFEECRDMQHLYIPFEEYRVDEEVKIYSPVNGSITSIFQVPVNQSGTWGQVEDNLITIVYIQSFEYPAFTISLSLIDIRGMGLKYGSRVSAGQHLGYGCMRYKGKVISVPWVRIGISVNTPAGERRLSYFDVITDDVFQVYRDRGATSRDDFIISKEDRDADPLECTDAPNIWSSTWIYDKGNILNWVYLRNDLGDFEIVSDYS